MQGQSTNRLLALATAWQNCQWQKKRRDEASLATNFLFTFRSFLFIFCRPPVPRPFDLLPKRFFRTWHSKTSLYCLCFLA
jgi:hypothetical protein